MPISARLLNRAPNRCVVTPAWVPIGDWLEVMACKPLATPLIDFGEENRFRVGVNTLNWYLMDLLHLRVAWLAEGWQSRSELWLLINPLRYRLLGHQPLRPYALDVRDYLRKVQPEVLHHSIVQHPHFALAPVVDQLSMDDTEAERIAARSPWGRIAVQNQQEQIIGMVWGMGPHTGSLPPVFNLANRKDS